MTRKQATIKTPAGRKLTIRAWQRTYFHTPNGYAVHISENGTDVGRYYFHWKQAWKIEEAMYRAFAEWMKEDASSAKGEWPTYQSSNAA